jgi:hypothetical protein
LNVADVVCAGTVAEAGTVSPEALSLRVTWVLAEGAGETVTVQEVLAFAARLAAVQLRLVSFEGAVSERTAVLEEPFRDAVMVAV